MNYNAPNAGILCTDTPEQYNKVLDISLNISKNECNSPLLEFKKRRKVDKRKTPNIGRSKHLKSFQVFLRNSLHVSALLKVKPDKMKNNGI